MNKLDGVCVIAGDGAMIRVADQHGEVTFEASLSVGRHDLSQYDPIRSLGVVELQNVVVVQRSDGRAGVMSYGDGQNDSGANPDWKPQFTEEQRIARLVDMVTDRKLRDNEEKKMKQAKAVEKRRQHEEESLKEESQKRVQAPALTIDDKEEDDHGTVADVKEEIAADEPVSADRG